MHVPSNQGRTARGVDFLHRYGCLRRGGLAFYRLTCDVKAFVGVAAMDEQADRCPACHRTFEGVLDYPRVRVLSFTRLPIPEALDYMSAAAAAKTLRHQRDDTRHRGGPGRRAINRTPEIDRACDTPAAREYLSCLLALPGREVDPRQLLPPFPPHSLFRWAHPIPDTSIYLSLRDVDHSTRNQRATEIQVHCQGPNMGSAGGPTLQPLGAIAELSYEGLLATPHERHGPIDGAPRADESPSDGP